MPARLQECLIILDDMVDDEGEMVNYALYADVKSANATEALKDLKWVKAMNDKLESIRVNNTWSLVEFSKGKKKSM